MHFLQSEKIQIDENLQLVETLYPIPTRINIFALQIFWIHLNIGHGYILRNAIFQSDIWIQWYDMTGREKGHLANFWQLSSFQSYSFSDCGKNESTKAFSAVLVKPTVIIFWHSGHSGPQSWVPECSNVRKLKRVG